MKIYSVSDFTQQKNIQGLHVNYDFVKATILTDFSNEKDAGAQSTIVQMPDFYFRRMKNSPKIKGYWLIVEDNKNVRLFG